MTAAAIASTTTIAAAMATSMTSVSGPTAGLNIDLPPTLLKPPTHWLQTTNERDQEDRNADYNLSYSRVHQLGSRLSAKGAYTTRPDIIERDVQNRPFAVRVRHEDAAYPAFGSF